MDTQRKQSGVTSVINISIYIKIASILNLKYSVKHSLWNIRKWIDFTVRKFKRKLIAYSRKNMTDHIRPEMTLPYNRTTVHCTVVQFSDKNHTRLCHFVFIHEYRTLSKGLC